MKIKITATCKAKEVEVVLFRTARPPLFYSFSQSRNSMRIALCDRLIDLR